MAMHKNGMKKNRGMMKNGMKKKNGIKNGMKKKNGNGNGLTAAQKKLPAGLQKAIMASKKKKK